MTTSYPMNQNTVVRGLISRRVRDNARVLELGAPAENQVRPDPQPLRQPPTGQRIVGRRHAVRHDHQEVRVSELPRFPAGATAEKPDTDGSPFLHEEIQQSSNGLDGNGPALTDERTELLLMPGFSVHNSAELRSG